MRSVFLDTNVLLDFLDEDRPLHLSAKSLFQKMIQEEFKIGMSEDMLTTLFYIASKKISVLKMVAFFQVLQKYVEIHAFGKEGIAEALEYLEKTPTEDFEDILQAVCAKQNGYDVLLTNDKSFPKGIMEVQKVGEFLEKM